MLIDDLSQLPKEFKSGFRGVLLLHRSKDGCSGNPQRKSFKRITNNEQEWSETVEEFRHMQAVHYPNHRIYASVNSRDFHKAIRKFKERSLQTDFASKLEMAAFYIDIQNRFFSCLMTPESRLEGNFLIDCDTHEEYEKALTTIPHEMILLDYETKNGRHLVTKPFNPNLYSGIEVKKDDLLYIG